MDPQLRKEILDLIRLIFSRKDRGESSDDLYETVGKLTDCPHVESLCHSDYPLDTIADLCIGWKFSQRLLNRDEMIDLVKRILLPCESEAEKNLMVYAFDYNCSHPAKNGLIFFIRIPILKAIFLQPPKKSLIKHWSLCS